MRVSGLCSFCCWVIAHQLSLAFPDLAGRDPVLCLREFMPLSTLYVGAIQLLAAFLPLFLMLSGASRQENFRQILDDGAASGIVS